MSQQDYARDLFLMTTVGIVTTGATIALGPLAGIAAFLLAVVLGAFISALRMLKGDLDQVDEHCSRIDQELDERSAREMLRTQRTVHAEPQAEIVDLFSGKPVA